MELVSAQHSGTSPREDYGSSNLHHCTSWTIVSRWYEINWPVHLMVLIMILSLCYNSGSHGLVCMVHCQMGPLPGNKFQNSGFIGSINGFWIFHGCLASKRSAGRRLGSRQCRWFPGCNGINHCDTLLNSTVPVSALRRLPVQGLSYWGPWLHL
jgi:hypothetical protein